MKARKIFILRHAIEKKTVEINILLSFKILEKELRDFLNPLYVGLKIWGFTLNA